MANVNGAFGLSPTQFLTGASYNGQSRIYYIPSSDTNAYAIGDPVTLIAGGDAVLGVQQAGIYGGGSTGTITGPLIGSITAMAGVIGGGLPTGYGGPGVNPLNPNTTVIPATKTVGYYIAVADDPNIVFEVQDDGSAAIAASGLNINYEMTQGNNSGYLSGWTLTASSGNTTSTFPLQILGLSKRLNNGYGVYAKWLVRINNHYYRGGTTAV